MRINKDKRNSKRTLFVRMLTTYILLTIFTSIIIGSSSLFIFKKFYIETINESVRENISINHQKIVTHINDIKDDILGSIFMQQYGFVPEILNIDLNDSSYISIKMIYDYLNQLVLENSVYVNGVHIYYKKNNILVSSKYGLKYLDFHNGEGIDLYWLNDIIQDKDVIYKWINTRNVAFTTSPDSITESNFSFVTKYPMTLGSKDSQIMISIDFNEEILKKKLNDYSKGINIILDKEGNIISSPLSDKDFIFDISKYSKNSGNYIESNNGIKSLVTYIKDPTNGWILINKHLVNGLYYTMNKIIWIILLICLFTAIIGIFVSFFIANNFYKPIKNILTMIRSYDKNEEICTGSEFIRIRSVIRGLNGHVDHLQDTISNSRSLLVAKLIRDLVVKRSLSKEEIDERFSFLDISLKQTGYMLMKVNINYVDSDELFHSQAQIIKYRLINVLESLSDDTNTLLVTDYEDNSILVLINTHLSVDDFIKTKIKDFSIIESVLSAEVYIRVFITDVVNELQNLYENFQQIEDMKRMVFYFPTQQILTSKVIAPIVSDSVFDSGRITKFEQMLYSGKDEIFEELDNIINEIIKAKYSITEKKKVLIKLMVLISNYMKDVGIHNKDIMDENVYRIFDTIADVNLFRCWITDVIHKVYKILNNSNSRISHDTITKVKTYIEDHIGEYLSLSMVADKVFLSPQYLSALFKKEEGLNFSTYLQHVRMEKAMILLIETNNKIEEVGIYVGYQTSHYFIKKFKETTGFTPKQYRSRNSRL